MINESPVKIVDLSHSPWHLPMTQIAPNWVLFLRGAPKKIVFVCKEGKK